MSTHLITGYKGQEHITSTDQASFNAAIMGNGEFVLERGEQFACQVISNNKVRIMDGDALMQGRHIIIDRNTYEETTHDNGTQGMQRIDLIVFTYTKDATTGVENAVVEVIKGTPSESNPAVPEYTKGDILNNGDLKNQMPLYQIPFNGLSIGTPVQMFQKVETLEGMKTGVTSDLQQQFDKLEASLEGKISDAGKPLSSNADEWSMIENYGEYSADAKTVGEEFAKVNNNLGGFTPIIDETGKITGYKTKIGGADTVFPFSSGLLENLFDLVPIYLNGDECTDITGGWVNLSTSGSVTKNGDSMTITTSSGNGAYYACVCTQNLAFNPSEYSGAVIVTSTQGTPMACGFGVYEGKTYPDNYFWVKDIRNSMLIPDTRQLISSETTNSRFQIVVQAVASVTIKEIYLLKNK